MDACGAMGRCHWPSVDLMHFNGEGNVPHKTQSEILCGIICPYRGCTSKERQNIDKRVISCISMVKKERKVIFDTQEHK